MAKYCTVLGMNTLVYMEEPLLHYYCTGYTGPGLGKACTTLTTVAHHVHH